MGNVNEPKRFSFDALNAKMVYGICTPKGNNDQLNSILNAKMVYGIRSPEEDVVDVKKPVEKKLSLTDRLSNFLSGLFKKEGK